MSSDIDTVHSHFQKILLNQPAPSVKFKHYEELKYPINSAYDTSNDFSKMVCCSPEIEEELSKLPEDMIFLLAEAMAEGMKDAYRDIIVSQLKEFRKQKEAI